MELIPAGSFPSPSKSMHRNINVHGFRTWHLVICRWCVVPVNDGGCFVLFILFSNVKKYVPVKTKDKCRRWTPDLEAEPVTAEYQSSALVTMLLVIGAIQLS